MSVDLTRDENDRFVSPFEKENEHTIVFKTNGLGKTYVATKRYIGGGGFGSVFVGFEVIVHEKTYTVIPSPRYAIKQNIDLSNTQVMRDEIKILEYMTDRIKCHPNVVCFYGWSNHGTIYYIVMEYIDGVSLIDYVNTIKRNRMKVLSTLFLELLRGLSYIDSLGMIHRDIKPDNILFTGMNNDIPLIKYVDFGLSCYIRYHQFENNLLTCNQDKHGTPGYMDPELFRSNDNVKINHDIFSLGATFYCLLTGKHPPSYRYREFYGEHENMVRHIDDALSNDEEYHEMGELIKSMISISHQKRPTIDKAILWLQGLDRSGNDAEITLSKIINTKSASTDKVIGLLTHLIRYPKLITTAIGKSNIEKIEEFKNVSEQQLIREDIDDHHKKPYREILRLIDNLQLVRLL
jgi:serine/threonine protein kinase